MFEINKGNMGFEIMIPKAPKKEEVKSPAVCYDHKLKLFGLEFRFLFSLTSHKGADQ